MNNSLEVYNNKLNIYHEDDYNKAVMNLSAHMKNKQYYLHDRKIVYSNVKIEVNYATKNLNHSYFNNCEFTNCNFECASFVNSKFINCIFTNCNLKSTNLRNSLISKCVFNEDNIIVNTRFGNSRIADSEFNGCNLDFIIFDEAILKYCTFKKNIWDAVSTYLCKFEDTIFDSVRFKNMNFEYSIFKNIHMNNMKIPFPTIPYIYGGLNYISTTKDNVRITSQHDVKKGISKDEYLLQINELEVFYTYTQNYFPLANIYLSQNKIDKCKAAIILGIKSSLLKSDLKMVENYSKLISFNSIFSTKERYDLYNDTLLIISKNRLLYEDNEINSCIFNLRTNLFNKGNSSSLHISFKTNIENENKLSIFIALIEKTISNINNCNYNIEIRHNSPYEFFLNVFSDYETLCFIAGIIVLSFKGVDTVIKSTLENIKTINEIKKQTLDNKLIKQQIAKNQIELDKESIINKEDVYKKCDETFRSIDEQNVIVQNISYFIVSNKEINIIPSSDVY